MPRFKRARSELTTEQNIEILERRGLLDEFTAEEQGETMGNERSNGGMIAEE